MTDTPNEAITLIIEAKGEIISSNFPAFAEVVRAHLATFNRDLKTDDEFDQADADAKKIATAEAALKLAKQKALGDAEQLNALFAQIDDLSGDLSTARLDLQKQVAKRKEEVRAELIEEHLAMFDIDPHDALRQFQAGMLAMIKGKRTVDSMRTALRVYTATSQAIITKSRGIVNAFRDTHGPAMVMDSRELELQKPEAVEAELRRRLEAKKASDERELLKADADKARSEADAARVALAESTKPPLPPSGQPAAPAAISAPAANVAQSDERAPWRDGDDRNEEWVGFRQIVFTTFHTLKAAKDGLRNISNVEKAGRFAAGVNAAWKGSQQ